MNVTEIFETSGVEIAEHGHHHAREGWIQIDCPFCSPKHRSFRMGWNEYGHYANCWVCGLHRGVETLIELGVCDSYGAASKLIAELKANTEAPAEKIKIVGDYKPPETVELKEQHIRYLKDVRKFDPDELVKLWSVRGIGMSLARPSLMWRIFIPIHYQGEPVSWLARSTQRNLVNHFCVKKYLAPLKKEERLDHKTLLYGEDYCRHAIIVCEGPMDAWRIGPGAVATFGVDYSKEQLARIAKYPFRAICFDNEEKAQSRAEKLCRELTIFEGETVNVRLKAKDAAEASPSELKRLRAMLA